MIPSEIRETLSERLKKLNLSINLLTKFCNFSASTISEWIAGRRPIRFEDALLIHEKLSALEDLHWLFEPAPLNWHDTEKIDLLLALTEQGWLADIITGNFSAGRKALGEHCQQL